MGWSSSFTVCSAVSIALQPGVLPRGALGLPRLLAGRETQPSSCTRAAEFAAELGNAPQCATLPVAAALLSPPCGDADLHCPAGVAKHALQETRAHRNGRVQVMRKGGGSTVHASIQRARPRASSRARAAALLLQPRTRRRRAALHEASVGGDALLGAGCVARVLLLGLRVGTVRAEQWGQVKLAGTVKKKERPGAVPPAGLHARVSSSTAGLLPSPAWRSAAGAAPRRPPADNPSHRGEPGVHLCHPCGV